MVKLVEQGEKESEWGDEMKNTPSITLSLVSIDLFIASVQAVLDLITWQEMEHRICGDPEISVEALKKSTHYDDLNATDQRVLHLWEAMEKWVEFEC